VGEVAKKSYMGSYRPWQN